MSPCDMKLKVRAICPGLNTDGCYSDIMPNVTGEQLAVLLEVGEQGKNAAMWSVLASRFLCYGQRELVAANADRLIGLIVDSYCVGWCLRELPTLTEAQRDVLASRAMDSQDAAWALRHSPYLTDKNRSMLAVAVTDDNDATLVLAVAFDLNNDHRDTLVSAVTSANNADWVLRKTYGLTDAQRKTLSAIK